MMKVLFLTNYKERFVPRDIEKHLLIKPQQHQWDWG